MWVGFLYTETFRVLLSQWETRLSRKGMELLSLGFSVVNGYMWVRGIDMLEELLGMFCLLDDKGVIHIPESQPWWIGGSGDGLAFKLFHKQVGC